MADDADIAQEINERLLESALADHFRRSRLQSTAPGPTHCIDCGTEIPLLRRRLVPGCRRCTDCQTILENWGVL